jgi:hypothetical protein
MGQLKNRLVQAEALDNHKKVDMLQSEVKQLERESSQLRRRLRSSESSSETGQAQATAATSAARSESRAAMAEAVREARARQEAERRAGRLAARVQRLEHTVEVLSPVRSGARASSLSASIGHRAQQLLVSDSDTDSVTEERPAPRVQRRSTARSALGTFANMASEYSSPSRSSSAGGRARSPPRASKQAGATTTTHRSIHFEASSPPPHEAARSITRRDPLPSPAQRFAPNRLATRLPETDGVVFGADSIPRRGRGREISSRPPQAPLVNSPYR